MALKRALPSTRRMASSTKGLSKAQATCSASRFKMRANHQGPHMSIKSDKWIRRMAEQHGMIEPFEPGQIRQNAAGQKIVSYGTSSYGYDIRCAPEFKVFTNIYSTVVEPKNFDERSFVDIEGDVCIIPPNSLPWPARSNISAFHAMC
jgi:hypothetical protein